MKTTNYQPRQPFLVISGAVSGTGAHAAGLSTSGDGITTVEALDMPLANKTGGALAYGDVVIVDSLNDAAVNKTATPQKETTIGVAAEAIAANSTGLIRIVGFVNSVNVAIAATRGHYIETNSTNLQATGNSTRRAGSFGQFLTSGLHPEAWLWGEGDQTASGGFADPMTTRGDIIIRDPSNVTSRFGIGNSTYILTSDGNDVLWRPNLGPAVGASDSSIAYSSGDVTTTSSLADVTGCTLSLAAGTWIVQGVFDVLVNSASDRTFEGHLDSGGSDQTNFATMVLSTLTNDRDAVVQTWLLTLTSTTTVKLRTKHSGGTTGTFTVKGQSAIAAWKGGTGGGSTAYNPPTIANASTNFAASGTTVAVTVTAPTTGDVLIMLIGSKGRGADSITQTNVTWTRRYTGNGNSQWAEIWTGVVSGTGGTTATANFTGSNVQEADYFQVTGGVAAFTSGTVANTNTAATTALATCGAASNVTVGDYGIWIVSSNGAASSYSGLNMPFNTPNFFGGELRGGIYRANTNTAVLWSLSASAVSYFAAIVKIA